MKEKAQKTLMLQCVCGTVEFAARGKPILASICYCDDCQRASHEIESLPGAPRILRDDGGTPYILYRKDRVTCLRGQDRLFEHRVEGEAFTKRVVASCCQSAMYLDFEKGHWLSLYRDRFQGDLPPVEMLIQTQYKPQDAVLPQGIPNYPGFPFPFIVKILAARIGMMFGR